MTNRIGYVKVIPRPEGFDLCDVAPDIQEHLNQAIDRIYRLNISDDFVAEWLPRALLQSFHDLCVERLDLSCYVSWYES
jgi:hypothetical protein